MKDEAINGNKINTNKLLDITTIDVDKSIYYIALLNQRLNKLKEIFNLKKESNLETTVNNLKPPIFWKDKPIIIEQMKKWNLKNINEALDNTYKHEIFIKKNSNVDKRIMVKKLVLDICNLANAS